MVLLWQSMPTQNGQAADVVLGQPDEASVDVNTPPSRGALQFRNPTYLTIEGTRLFVADTSNHRVLIWNKLPRGGTTAPDVVLGQPDFIAGLANTGLAAPTAATLFSPIAIAVGNGRLAVADANNNRVLVWNQVPTQSFTPADLVLGQSDFTLRVVNPASSGLNQPAGVLFVGTDLYVADSLYHRVLLYRNPSTSGALPLLALGQPSLSTGAVNNGGLSARSLSAPRGLFTDGEKLFIADRGNHRVLIFNSFPTQNAQAADVVVGQLNFGSASQRLDRTHTPGAAAALVYNGRLYVLSQAQSRILYWNRVPTSNGQRADGVLGQADFLSSLSNNPDVPLIERLSGPFALGADADQLYIADSLNNRVVVRSLPL